MKDYRAFCREALIIDSHNDTITAHIRAGNRSLFRPGESLDDRYSGVVAGPYGFFRPEEPHFQIDIPQMQAAGIDLGFFAVDVTGAFHHHLAQAMDAYGFLQHDIEASGADVQIVRRVGDIAEAREKGRPAILLAIEHADATARSLNVLRMLYEVGVRSIGLTHNRSSCAADGCGEAREGVGLTDYGVELVREMNRLGIVVDLAHVSPAGFMHALKVSEKPVLFSHGNAAALCPHQRNLSDAQLEALAENGGVIGLSYVPSFVHPSEPTLQHLLDHVDHVAEVAGIDHVGLGSDFDGGGLLLEDAGELENLVAGLFERGYAEADVRKVLGLNTLRVLEQVLP